MRYSSAALVLATAIINPVVAGPHPRHAHFHDKRDVVLGVEDQLDKRDVVVTTVHITATIFPDGHTVFPTVAASPAPPPPPPTSSAAPSPSPSQSPVIALQVDKSKSSGSTGGDLTDAQKSTLTDKLGFNLGVNAKSSSGGVWIGADGPYTNTFQNNAGVDLILVIWQKGQAFLVHSSFTPLITSSLPSGASLTISFADGSSGGWAAIYPDTLTLMSGQVQNTIGEYTFTNMGAVDVSRMHQMTGHPMSIQGPTPCVSDMNNCVFVCNGVDPSTGSSDFCWQKYQLLSCSGPGSQSGYDPVMQGDSGGCSWPGNSAAFTTTFS